MNMCSEESQNLVLSSHIAIYLVISKITSSLRTSLLNTSWWMIYTTQYTLASSWVFHKTTANKQKTSTSG